MDAFQQLVRELAKDDVRFVVIGVWGANYYAMSGATLLTTEDRDLFLPSDAGNLLTAWRERRVFRVEGVEIPVARLTHIVTSKANANRPKDRLFLETHAEALKDLMED